ncbi:polysaccharide deacetylase family protein [Rhodococcus sp. P1Y]|uniref:polysaccharide deacetylase family protein n=1 Tax=Rhodococcus sp. P1Y TaxID=1302308 RepID=UPI00137960EB|nr:polysaccharide deacetylase family protein [Rhodococcus sp. P1Y]
MDSVPKQVGADQWTVLQVSLDNPSSVVGTGAGSAVQTARVAIAGVGGQTTPTKFGEVSFFARQKYPKGCIAFTFDDSWATTKTAALATMNQYRFRGTIFPWISLLGANASYLTLADLRTFQDLHGWEIGAHCTTEHVSFSTYGSETLEATLQYMKRFLVTDGFRSECIAYPGSNSSPAVRYAAAQYFR